ncbi:MAG: hypothetical protein U0325_25325 [Polyangiales bacterium]
MRELGTDDAHAAPETEDPLLRAVDEELAASSHAVRPRSASRRRTRRG